jgi:hypothetical protein
MGIIAAAVTIPLATLLLAFRRIIARSIARLVGAAAPATDNPRQAPSGPLSTFILVIAVIGLALGLFELVVAFIR